MMKKTIQKPPIGLRPRFIADELRVAEILQAVMNYGIYHRPIPDEWLEELRELLNRRKANDRKRKTLTPNPGLGPLT